METLFNVFLLQPGSESLLFCSLIKDRTQVNENSLCPQGARGPHTFLYGMNKKNPIVEKRRKIILKKVETTIGKKGA